MQINRSYILWLPSWYPNKVQPFNGDFVRRHAEALTLFEQVEVLHVIKDEEGKYTRGVKTEIVQNGNLRETVIYYYQPFKKPAFLTRILSQRKYKSLYKQAINNLIVERGKPSLVHSYIALKAGSLALWIKKKYNIPFVVSEQSTIYLKEAKPNLSDFSFIFRSLAKKIYQNAIQVMVVSIYLGDRLQQLFGIDRPVVIPNVVNDKVFNYNKNVPIPGNTLLHISTLDYQKNPESIINAIALVKERGYEIKLNIVGPKNESLYSLVQSKQLQDHIRFFHERPQTELVELMKESSALVLFSRYETFGCVLIEAFACGLPVIVSDIPVFHENVNDSNGLFAQNDNTSGLADKLIEFINGKKTFNPDIIAENAIAKYNYARVGQQLSDWYKEVLSKQQAKG